jgi:hypothetical protein
MNVYVCRVPGCPLAPGCVCLATKTLINTAGSVVRGTALPNYLKWWCVGRQPPPPTLPTCSVAHVQGKWYPGNFELVIRLHIHSICVPFSTAVLEAHLALVLLARL